MIPATSQRVPLNTSDTINRRIRDEMEARVASYQDASPAEITDRLKELDQEWDTERFLEMNASALAFTGCALAAAFDRRWLVLPLAVTGFLLQHAVQGWCPPVPMIRRLGFRTMREIDEERFALKALRGDFKTTGRSDSGKTSPQAALKAVAK